MWRKQIGRQRPNPSRAAMRPLCMRIVAAAFGAAMLFVVVDPILAQGADPKAGDKQGQAGDGKDGQKKLDEFAEAEKLLGGPAANPECVWLGRRVVSLLWTRRSRYRFPASRPLRPLRLPVRAHPGDLPLPGAAGRYRSEGDRHAQQPHPRLLDQSELRGEGHRRGAGRHHHPVVCTNVQDRAR